MLCEQADEEAVEATSDTAPTSVGQLPFCKLWQISIPQKKVSVVEPCQDAASSCPPSCCPANLAERLVVHQLNAADMCLVHYCNRPHVHVVERHSLSALRCPLDARQLDRTAALFSDQL